MDDVSFTVGYLYWTLTHLQKPKAAWQFWWNSPGKVGEIYSGVISFWTLPIPFTMCVMQLQFVPTHISVQVVRGSKRGAKKHFSGTFSKKY